MGMQVDGNTDLGFQGRDKFVSRIGLQQSCHILHAQDVGTCILQVLGKAQVVIQVVFCFGPVQDIPRITKGAFGQATGSFPDVVYAGGQ